MNRVKKIADLYLNSLLKISDQDEESAQKLLENEGINAVSLVNKTLKNINTYEFALMEKAAANHQQALLEKVIEKISILMQKAPERVTAIIDSIIQPRVPVFRFKNTSYSSDISEVFDMIDPVQLFEKLIALERELN